MSDDNNKKDQRKSKSSKKLWEFVTKSVVPIENSERNAGFLDLLNEKVELPKPTKTVFKPQKKADLSDLATWRQALKETKTQEWQGDEMALRQAKRFRQGKLPIEARLDLHGMTQKHAHTALLQFVHHAYHQQYRCILVITGKGQRSYEKGGVLRQALPKWLKDTGLKRMILSFETAQPKDGGSGAYYILLRRHR